MEKCILRTNKNKICSAARELIGKNAALSKLHTDSFLKYQ